MEGRGEGMEGGSITLTGSGCCKQVHYGYDKSNILLIFFSAIFS